MKGELLIQNGKKIYIPVVQEGIEWSTERFGSPGKLTFKVMKDDTLKITEGNVVRFKWDGKNIFYGFIFSKSSDKEDIFTITAYDQLRYFKNKQTYVYENMNAGDVIKMIAKDFKLKTGTIENTGYKIKSRVEDDVALFDIVQNALDLTITNKGDLFVMYDDFGKISLKNISSMKLNMLLDESTGENFDYSSSIDDNVYNKIKLYYDNKKTKKREVYVTQSSEKINKWGVLQYYEKLQDGENGKAKADALLKLYCKKTRNLSVKNVIGRYDVRAGSLIPTILDLEDVKVQNYMLVEKCKHTFKLDEHFMDLTLRGGDFVA